jgi:uncharacterized membrane protein
MEYILFSFAAWLLFAILVLAIGLAIVWVLFVLLSTIDSNSQYDILDSEHNEH